MKLVPFLISVLSNVVAGIVLLLLTPALAVALAMIGLRELDRVEDGGCVESSTLATDPRLADLRLPPPEPEPPAPPPALSPPPPSPPPGEPAFERHPRTCTDAHGNLGTFDVVVFSRAYSWVQGETQSVELNDTATDFPHLLQTSGLNDYLRVAPEIIALGTASCEGYPEHREREVRRAMNRANKLMGWIEAARRPRPGEEPLTPVKPLPLGVFARECHPGEDTWPQRRVVLLAIRERDERLLLYDCLRRALEADDGLSYLATAYSPGLPGSSNQPDAR